MANYCYNNVIITGNNKEIIKIKELFENYQNFDFFYKFGNSFFPEALQVGDYGTKWWDFDISYDEDENGKITTLNITGDSAWAPPRALIGLISLHYNVDCEIEYSESGCDFAGTTKWENGVEVFREETTYSEYIYVKNGIKGVINEYLYDEDCVENYESASEFIEHLAIEISLEDRSIVIKEFNKLKKGFTVEEKKQMIKELVEIKTQLQHLCIDKLALKVNSMIEKLSDEWHEDLKPLEDGKNKQ